ncbi:MAG: universal stress protein [Bacteroidetes bacterium]|nr:universal stress protein [Bacteroidota bacterium]
MERKIYRNCLGGLDQSDSDKYIVAHLASLVEQISLQKTIFAHVDQFKPESTSAQKSDFRGAEPTALSRETDFGPDDMFSGKMDILNLEGNPETVLADCIEKHDIDLACVGLKDNTSRFSKVGRKLLCITDADVLFIPPVSCRKFNRILIPADLSEKSYQLVEKTRTQFPKAAIEIFFVNYIPPETVMKKEDRDKLIATSSDNLDKSMADFISSLSCNKEDIKFGYTMSEHFNAGYAIYEHALETNFDLIVIGRLSSLDKELPFLGSVTEKILFLNKKLPVLVINH